MAHPFTIPNSLKRSTASSSGLAPTFHFGVPNPLSRVSATGSTMPSASLSSSIFGSGRLTRPQGVTTVRAFRDAPGTSSGGFLTRKITATGPRMPKSAVAKAADVLRRRSSGAPSATSRRLLNSSTTGGMARNRKLSNSPKELGQMKQQQKAWTPSTSDVKSKGVKEEKIIAPTLSRSEACRQLRALVGRTCSSVLEQYQLLHERDQILYKARTKLTDVESAGVVQGTCEDMCPEKERYIRVVQKRLSQYECDEHGSILHPLTVKDYSRSAADQEEPLAHELRPRHVLVRTMDYLIGKIARDCPQNDANLVTWYDFLWNRTRAIRKDLTQQMMINETAVDLIEKCARLHIFVSHRLCELDLNDFDQKMNTENLTKCLQSLRHLYEDLNRKGIHCRNEVEFRAYDVLLNLNDSNILRQVLTYAPGIRKSSPMRLALALFSTIQNNNYVRFFHLVRTRATFLQACLCHRYFTQVRIKALIIMTTSYAENCQYPVSELTSLFGFSTEEEMITFANIYGVTQITKDGKDFRLSRKRFMIPESAAQSSRCDWIEHKMDHWHLAQVLSGDAESKSDFFFPEPTNSFDANGVYRFDPIVRQFLADGDAGADEMEEKPSTMTQQKSQEMSLLEQEFVFEAILTMFKEECDPFVQKIVCRQWIEAVSDFFLTKMIYDCIREYSEKSLKLALINERERLRLANVAHLRQLAKELVPVWTENIVLEMTKTLCRTTAQKSMRLAQKESELRMVEATAVALGDRLINAVTSELAAEICGEVHSKKVVMVKIKLDEIRNRLDDLWLRQFTDRWRQMVVRRRETRKERQLIFEQFPVAPTGPGLRLSMSKRSPNGTPFFRQSSEFIHQKEMEERNWQCFVHRVRRDILRYCFDRWRYWADQSTCERRFFTGFLPDPSQSKRRRLSISNLSSIRDYPEDSFSAVLDTVNRQFVHSDEKKKEEDDLDIEYKGKELPLDVSMALCDMDRIQPRISPFATPMKPINRWQSLPSCLQTPSIKKQKSTLRSEYRSIVSPTQKPLVSPPTTDAHRLLTDFKQKMANMAEEVNRDRKWFDSLLNNG